MNIYAQLLTDWLKKEGYYEQFMENLKADKGEPDTIHEYIIENNYNKSDTIAGAIGGAFMWSNTSQGNTYWEDVDDEWEAYIDTLTFPLQIKANLKTFNIKEYV